MIGKRLTSKLPNTITNITTNMNATVANAALIDKHEGQGESWQDSSMSAERGSLSTEERDEERKIRDQLQLGGQ
jgi:hypothetical protein